MIMPGFAAESSLYKTATFYRGFGQVAGGYAAASVVPQDSCSDTCAQNATICVTACTVAATLASIFTFGILTGPAAAAYSVCLATCAANALACSLRCPSSGGSGGNGNPEPSCCPPGKVCSCGGRCVLHPNGSISCVGGLCLGKNERCP
jgi:hypothetical protein